jgi:peptide/nickel transport system ATP-binding protein
MRLLPQNATVVKGHIAFDNQDLFTLTDDEMKRVRWNEISMIFQAAMNALNPVHRVADQIMEAIAAHHPNLTTETLWKQVANLFDLVNIPRKRMAEYPHQYSGGMRQRAIIAMALACKPSLVIADEPTTALDVILQSQILQSIKQLQQELNLAIIFISHDIAVVADVCHDIGVMYAGRLVEFGNRDQILDSPAHPYTKTLISSYLKLMGDPGPPQPKKGAASTSSHETDACCFLHDCPDSEDACRNQKPSWVDLSPGHRAYCVLAGKATSEK